MTRRYIRIELAPNDMRTLEALTRERKGYLSPGHLQSVAEDLIAQALTIVRDETEERTD